MTQSGFKLVNLAFRVRNLGEAESLVETSPSWTKRALHDIDGVKFLQAEFGGVAVNLFETALYDSGAAEKAPGFLHMSFSVPDLARAMKSAEWSDKLVWGPSTIEGAFGRRRIAFFEPFQGCRIELMEEMSD